MAAEKTEETPLWDMIPLVSQGKSLFQLVFGDSEGAKKTQKNFLDEGLGSSQLRSVYFLAKGNAEKALDIQKKFFSNLESVVDGTPIVGHVKGAIHLLAGDKDHGWSAIKSATSTSGAVIGGLLSGPIGAVSGHLMTDMIITAADKVINGNRSQTYGLVDYIANVKDHTSGEHFDAIANLILDSKVAKKMKSKSNLINIKKYGRKESAESHLELKPLIDRENVKTKRIVGMPVPLDSGVDTGSETMSGYQASDSSVSSSEGSDSESETDHGSESESGSDHESESESVGESEEMSVSDESDSSESESVGESEVEMSVSDESVSSEFIRGLNEYEKSHILKFKAFFNFLRNDELYKVLNLYYFETLDLLKMRFRGLNMFEHDVFLDRLNVESLTRKLSYLSDVEKSLIDKNDFRTVSNGMHLTSFLCSLAGIMKITVEDLRNNFLERLERGFLERGNDPNEVLHTSVCLDELQRKNIINVHQSAIINGAEELNQHLKDRASELENKHIMIHKIADNGKSHSVVLKYKMINGNPVTLFVDYWYQGFIQPNVPHPFRFRSYINFAEYNRYFISLIE